MYSDDFMVIYPNRCVNCDSRRVPVEKRTVLVFGCEEICGVCGSKLGSTTSIHSTLQLKQYHPMLKTIVRSLVQHGVFAIDSSPGSMQPMRLCREDAEADGLITCHISYSTMSDKSELKRSCKRYKRNEIGFAMPESVRDACELLGDMRMNNLDGSPAYMSFDSADMKRERKTIRFSWVCRVDFDNGERYNYLQTSLEIAWTELDISSLQTLAPLDLSNLKNADLSEEERIKADILRLRLAVHDELKSKSPIKSIGIYSTISFEQPPKTGNLYHPVAVDQVIRELEDMGLKAERQGPSLLGTSFLTIERKK